jgi:uncharacterized protein (UPF0335 family)
MPRGKKVDVEVKEVTKEDLGFLFAELADKKSEVKSAEGELEEFFKRATDKGAKVKILKQVVALRDSEDWETFAQYLCVYEDFKRWGNAKSACHVKDSLKTPIIHQQESILKHGYCLEEEVDSSQESDDQNGEEFASNAY